MLLINENYYRPKKSLGQNFLVDLAVIQQIITTINLEPNDLVIEIGPGLGAITKHILHNCGKLIAIEIDSNLCEKLNNKFSQEIIQKKLEIVNKNILHVELQSIIDKASPNNFNIKVVGNLPYNIATPLLFKLFSDNFLIKDLHFLVQQEVAERLVAAPNSKQYGRLSIMAQYHGTILKLFNVNPTSFNPKPKVMSSFIKIIPYRDVPYKAIDYSKLYKLVTSAFSKRRKMISNTLKLYCTANDLLQLEINPTWRAEQLSISDFVKISNFIT